MFGLASRLDLECGRGYLGLMTSFLPRLVCVYSPLGY